jgi:uncharacterized protein (DUF1330 family)
VGRRVTTPRRCGSSAHLRFRWKLVARGAKVEILEGEHDARPVVMFEFPSMEAIRAFWNSPEYVPVKKRREGIATLNVWAFPGVAADVVVAGGSKQHRLRFSELFDAEKARQARLRAE